MGRQGLYGEREGRREGRGGADLDGTTMGLREVRHNGLSSKGRFIKA